MSSRRPRQGLLFVVSAPSGTGKTTLVEQLVRTVPRLQMSRSYTSRSTRPGECDGVDYNFISRARFEEMVARGEFLEWADVFGNLYGTSRPDTDALLRTGEDVVLVIDVKGARQVRRMSVPPAISVFVLPPSFAVLEARLRGRCKDAEEAIRTRLATAREEVAAFTEYDYVVVNDDVETCVDRLRGIVMAERARLAIVRAEVEEIVNTFRGEDRS